MFSFNITKVKRPNLLVLVFASENLMQHTSPCWWHLLSRKLNPLLTVSLSASYYAPPEQNQCGAFVWQEHASISDSYL